MKKLTNKQLQILDHVRDAIDVDVVVLNEFLEQGRKDMVRHCQESISEKLRGIRSYIIFSDDTKGNKNWNAIKDEFRAIQNMPVLKLQVWLDLLNSDKAVSEEEWKSANAQ